jgi:hypothetical protein
MYRHCPQVRLLLADLLAAEQHPDRLLWIPNFLLITLLFSLLDDTHLYGKRQNECDGHGVNLGHCGRNIVWHENRFHQGTVHGENGEGFAPGGPDFDFVWIFEHNHHSRRHQEAGQFGDQGALVAGVSTVPHGKLHPNTNISLSNIQPTSTKYVISSHARSSIVPFVCLKFLQNFLLTFNFL